MDPATGDGGPPQIDPVQAAILAAASDMKQRVALEEERSRHLKITIENSWREVLRLAKTEQLREEITVLSQAHERDLEHRQAAISSLLDELDIAEEQFQHAVRTHNMAINRLMDIQAERVAALEEEFKRDVQRIEDEYTEERAGLITGHRQQRNELLHVIRAAREDEDTKIAAMEAEFQQVRETVRRRALERIHTLQTDMDSAIEALERAFEEAHAKYIGNTDQRTQDFKALSSRGQHDAQMKERQKRTIKRLQARLHYWQGKLAHTVADTTERNQQLEEEKEAMAKHLDLLKGEMARASSISNERLKTLSKLTEATHKALEEQLTLAKRILTTAESLRAFESHGEKVLPFARTALDPALSATAGAGDGGQREFAAPPVTGEEEIGGAGGLGLTLNRAAGAATLDLAALSALPEEEAEVELMGRFYDRFNAALLEKLALEKRREELAARNAELRRALKDYLEGLAAPRPEELGQPNTLLVVNGQLPLGLGPETIRAINASKNPEGKTVVQEAGTILVQYVKQTG